jgi:hypothetical protein
MAGPVLDRKLAHARPAPGLTRVQFALARAEDDGALRRLLRTTPMHGAIQLTFEREPAYFSGSGLAGATDQTIVSFENGNLICMGRCSIQERHLNGAVRRVGYLGELRLDGSARGRFDILRRGYQYFRQLHEMNPPAAWFTSIAADNHRSIRFLERQLPGMPRYDLLGGFVTLVIAVPRRAATARRLGLRAEASLEEAGVRREQGSPELVERMARQLAEHGERFQFSSGWTASTVQSLAQWGLPLDNWECVFRGPELVGCMALWDQRGFRQIVVRDFDPALRILRPLANLAAWASGVPGIPSTGSVLAQGFLSPLAFAPGDEGLLIPMIESTLPHARERGLDYLTLGLPAGDNRRAIMKSRFRAREYHSRIYRVSWPEDHAGIVLEERPVYPEVALL